MGDITTEDKLDYQSPNQFSSRFDEPIATGSFDEPAAIAAPAFACAAFDSIKIRAAFVRKVFGIVCLQLLITFSIVAVCSFVEPLKRYIQANVWVYITSIITFFVIYFVLVCSSKAARKVPLNYIFLLILTLAMSFMFGVTASFYDTLTVVVAFGITMVVTFAMILFSLQTKYDLTKRLYLPLMAGLMCLLMFGFLSIIFRSQVLSIMYASIGALIFSLFIAFDIQLIVGGKRISLSEEDYVFGALMLYMDIVQVFVMMLYLVGVVRN